jgi:hypothetical protein
MEQMVQVNHADLLELYSVTASAPGLVHASAGPLLYLDKYNVHLGPLGRQGQYELLDSEEGVKRMVYGLLHGLAAIHEVGWVM